MDLLSFLTEKKREPFFFLFGTGFSSRLGLIEEVRIQKKDLDSFDSDSESSTLLLA